MSEEEFGKITYDGPDEVHYDFGDFWAMQKKDKYGQALGRIWVYDKHSQYYDTTSFATFSSLWHIKRFMKNPYLEEKVRLNV